jgi:hypothetical protein
LGPDEDDYYDPEWLFTKYHPIDSDDEEYVPEYIKWAAEVKEEAAIQEPLPDCFFHDWDKWNREYCTW